MQISQAKKGINYNLEALRGFAALFVVFNHIEALHTAFNPAYLPTATIVLAPNGRLLVLVFFVLSGYVIGLNHPKPLQGAEVGIYVRKRLLRIFPIYVLALILTLSIAQHRYQWGDILGNFLMLQVLTVPPFIENGPAWSLHYELVYYAIFIPISHFKWNLPWLIVICVVSALGGLGILSSYFFGLAFWLAGLFIAQTFTQQPDKANYGKLAAGVSFLLAFDQLLSRPGFTNVILHMMYKLPGAGYFAGLSHSSPLIHHPQDLFYLPIYAFIIIIFSGKKWRFESLAFGALNVLLLVAIAVSVYRYKHADTANFKVYLLSVGYYIIALMLWYGGNAFEGLARPVIKLGVWLGGISYALYIIHAPVIYLLGRVTLWPGNNPGNYILKLILCFVLIIPVAWLLEKRFQPWVKRITDPKTKTA